jgi:hypothetical protein
MSNNLRSVLQKADPALHEEPVPDTKREQARLKILREAAIVRSTKPVRASFAVAIGIAVVAVTAVGYGIWLHGTTLVLAAVGFEVRRRIRRFPVWLWHGCQTRAV